MAQIPEAAKGLKEKLAKIEDELIQHRAKGMQDTLNYPVKLNANMYVLGEFRDVTDSETKKLAFELRAKLVRKRNRRISGVCPSSTSCTR